MTPSTPVAMVYFTCIYLTVNAVARAWYEETQKSAVVKGFKQRNMAPTLNAVVTTSSTQEDMNAAEKSSCLVEDGGNAVMERLSTGIRPAMSCKQTRREAKVN